MAEVIIVDFKIYLCGRGITDSVSIITRREAKGSSAAFLPIKTESDVAIEAAEGRDKNVKGNRG